MSETRAELAYKARIGNAMIDDFHDRYMAHVRRALSQTLACQRWSTPLPRPPGIYWRRTGGKTHTVEVVR